MLFVVENDGTSVAVETGVEGERDEDSSNDVGICVAGTVVSVVGAPEGTETGLAVGVDDGFGVGLGVGDGVRMAVGALVGQSDGLSVVGLGVGSSEGLLVAVVVLSVGFSVDR